MSGTTITIIALIIFSVFLGIVLINIILKRDQKEERMKLMEEQLEVYYKENKLLEAERYKFQLQPHTLKNLFDQMNTFANKLNKGMESLSSTLEYIFYKGADHYVTVEDELEFIQKYLKLNDLFISEPFAIKWDFSEVDENIKKSKNKRIPHLITAYFLENAFKHGDKTHPEFLRVKVFTTKDAFEIHVINKLRPNSIIRSSTGTGLVNMKKRLDIFATNNYEIFNSCNEGEYISKLTIRFT